MQNTTNTNQQYQAVVNHCRDVFLQKTSDYGTSWRVLRPISVADQIYIKARRIRTLQETGKNRVGDNITSEFQGILNYAVIGLMQLQLNKEEPEDLKVEEVQPLYNAVISQASRLMQDKNHDYGEAWREMSQESFVDLTLAKLMRIRQILANDGKTVISEGIDANLLDIVNYAAFALILIGEGKHRP
jgi:Nucleotide modification associated domain 1